MWLPIFSDKQANKSTLLLCNPLFLSSTPFLSAVYEPRPVHRLV
ncbi:MAG: hypothetical protein ACI9C4_002714 [Paraglaciecola sp.]